MILIITTAGAFTVYYLVWHRNGPSRIKYVKDGEIKKTQPLWCENAVIDFGYVYRPVNELVEHMYRIENTSSKPLKLKIAGKSCTCEKIELTHDQLNPGQFTELQMSWKVPSQLGPHAFEVFVEAVPKELGQVRLYGKISVIDHFVVEPFEISFGNIKPNETITKELKIQAPPGYDFSPNLSFSIKNDPNKTLRISTKQKTTYKMVLEISLTGQACMGLKDYGIIMKTGNPVQPEIQIPVHVNHLDLYQVQPAVVVFNKNQINNDAKWIKIISNSKTLAKIERFIVDNPSMIDVHPRICDSDEMELGLSLKKSNPQGSHTGKIEVFLLGQAHPVIVRYLYLSG